MLVSMLVQRPISVSAIVNYTIKRICDPMRIASEVTRNPYSCAKGAQISTNGKRHICLHKGMVHISRACLYLTIPARPKMRVVRAVCVSHRQRRQQLPVRRARRLHARQRCDHLAWQRFGLRQRSCSSILDLETMHD